MSRRNPAPVLLSATKAAVLIGVSTEAVMQWIRAGVLPAEERKDLGGQKIMRITRENALKIKKQRAREGKLTLTQRKPRATT